jgi:NRAMP (natural resistance-associated macrophage protein)-like metal ion transporter
MRRLRRYRPLVILALIGPGIITSAADNDAGGIITYIQAGAKYRYDLLWVLVLITFALAIIQEMSARMGTVTQKGLGELIRENFGVKWTLFALGTLLVANLATTVSEFAGLAASLEIFGVSRLITVPVAAVVIWLLVVKGSFKVVERVFLIIAMTYATYVVSGLLSNPNWGTVFHDTYAPTFHADPKFMFLAIAVIGTTITPWMQFFLQATVVDKGVRIENYGYQKWDVYIGSFLTDLVSFFIIVAAGAVIWKAPNGVHISNPAQAAAALQPVAHGYAKALFSIGLFSASLLAAAVLPLSTAYTYSEAFGWEIGISRKFREAPIFYSIYSFCIVFGAGAVLLTGRHLIALMIRAQAVNGILLPVILIFMLKLINRSDVMGKYTNSRLYNVCVWAMVILLIAMTAGWLAGLALGFG